MSYLNQRKGNQLKAAKKSGKQARHKILQVLQELVNAGIETDDDEFVEVGNDYAKTFDYSNQEELENLNFEYA